jgi:hypothetical protein
MKFERGDLARTTMAAKPMAWHYAHDPDRVIAANSPVIIIGPSEVARGYLWVFFPTYATYGDWPTGYLTRPQEKEEA